MSNNVQGWISKGCGNEFRMSWCLEGIQHYTFNLLGKKCIQANVRSTQPRQALRDESGWKKYLGNESQFIGKGTIGKLQLWFICPMPKIIRSLPLCTSEQTTPILSTKDYRVLLSSCAFIFAPSPNVGFVGVQEATRMSSESNARRQLIHAIVGNFSEQYVSSSQAPLIAPKGFTLCTLLVNNVYVLQ